MVRLVDYKCKSFIELSPGKIFSPIRPFPGRAGGLGPSVLNRVYNFERVCPNQGLVYPRQGMSARLLSSVKQSEIGDVYLLYQFSRLSVKSRSFLGLLYSVSK